MRLSLFAPLCRVVLASLTVAATMAGCGGTVPVAPSAAPAAAPKATAPAPQPATLADVQALVGRYPSDGVDFLRTGPLAHRLHGLMGTTNYPVLLENLGVSGPLQQQDDLLYITGNRPHQGGSEAAAVVVNPAKNAVRVWLLTGGEVWDVQDYGTVVALPTDVRTLMDNARR